MVWSPDRTMLEECLKLLVELDGRNRCNTREDLELHQRTQTKITEVEKHLRMMGVLRSNG